MSRRNRLQTKIIASMTRVAVRQPRWVIGLSLAIAAVSIALMVDRVQLKTNRADLLSPNSQFQTDWLKYASEFGAHDDVLVIVSARDPSRVQNIIDRIGERLRQHPDRFKNVHDRFQQDRLASKGLYFIPTDQLLSIERMVQQWTQVLDDSASDPSIWQSALHQSAAGNSSPWSEVLRTAVADPTGYEFPWSVDAIERQLRARLPRYSVMNNGQLGIVSLHLVISADEFARGRRPIALLRKIVDEIARSADDVELGITGLPVIEYDEMATSERDMTRASLITLAMVTLLFAAGFGNLRYPIFAIIALLIGIMWTCGYLTFTLGHVNILSMSFGVILIGLGVDFSIHYVARFLSLRKGGVSIESAINRTAIGVGPAIVAGGISTALAFFATGTAEFLGVAELGIIAGGGILLCVLATVLVLPAMLSLPHRVDRVLNPPETLWSDAAGVMWNRPRQTIIWGLGITIFLALGMTRLEYDHNLLNLQAANLESVAWERRLLDESNGSVWHAISIAGSPSEVEQRRKAFLQLKTVKRVEDLTELVPAATHEHQQAIQRIHARLRQVSTKPPVVAPLRIDQIPSELMALGRQAFGESSPRSTSNTTRPEWLARIDLVRARLLTDLWTQLQAIRRISNPDPPSLADVPTPIRNRFVGKSGKRMLRVYARDDIWQPAELERFVHDISTVDAAITGAPIQAYYASRQMRQSYLHAAGYAAIAVFAVLWWDLRRLDLVALAALPTLLGLTQLFGLMGLLQIPLNPANVIVLPLVLGIGIDDGIHVVHDLRRSANRRSLKTATTNGIVMTSLTSMVGFGSLMLAQHEGLRSLGRVVTLGITCCLLSSTLWLPCLLAMLSTTNAQRRRSIAGGKLHDDTNFAAVEKLPNLTRQRRRNPGTRVGGSTPLDVARASQKRS